MRLVAFGRVLARRLLIVMLVVLASLPLVGPASPASAQGTATIEITNIDAGTGLPVPFTRFQVTSENGTVYGPMETDLNGYVAFAVTVDPQGTRFTVEEETPPACAPAPDPQTTDPLLAGERASLEFSTQDNPGCGLGTIALYAMSCPDGFTGPSDDYGPWRDGCTGTNDGTGFTVSSVATGEIWNPIAGAYGVPGRAPLVGLPSGDYTIQQNGDLPSSVFCLVYDTANYPTSPEPSSVIEVLLTNGVGTVSLNGGRLSCDVFTVPGGLVQPEPTQDIVEPAANAILDVHIAQCPEGYVPTETIYDDCHGNGLDAIPVQLSSSNGLSGTVATNLPATPGPGVASFANLAGGRYIIGADIPADSTSLTYCSDDAFVEVPATFDDASRTLTLDLVSGQIVTCDWYVIPNVVQPAVGTSYLEMHAVLCPNGTDPESALYDQCHSNGLAGVTYTVNGPNGFSGQATTTVPTEPGPGIAMFGSLTAGAFTITQAGVDPSSELVAYCSLADADVVVPVSYVDADTISLDLPVDTGVVCDWYAIPLADANTTLHVTSYRCVFNMVADAETPLASFQEDCQPSEGTTQFTLTPDGAESVTRTTGSAGVGTVLFEPLTTNSYALQSSIPGDFNDAYVFCGVEGGALPFSGQQGLTIAIDATQGPYACEWFNVGQNASGYSDTLSVMSYLCPPGTSAGYADRCGNAPLAGTTLLLDRNGRDELDTSTNANGFASFEGLLPGNYTITTLPPAGTNVAVYVVSCVAGGQPFEFSYSDQQSMSIVLELPGDVDVECAWYNIPPGAPAVIPGETSGSITVHKFLCQGKSINQYNWDSDCVAEKAPIAFSLKTTAGLPIAVGTTNGAGILTFTNLANGAYNLDETSGDWCHAEADRVDSAGNVLVQNGGENNVYVYNCSLQNVDNLPSTGSGATGSDAPAGFGNDRIWQLVFGAMATLGIALLVRHGLQQAVVNSTDANEESLGRLRGDEPLV